MKPYEIEESGHRIDIGSSTYRGVMAFIDAQLALHRQNLEQLELEPLDTAITRGAINELKLMKQKWTPPEPSKIVPVPDPDFDD